MCILSDLKKLFASKDAPIKVIKYCIILIIILVLAIIILYTIVPTITGRSYSLFFDDGNITFEHDSVTFVISNNNQPGNKTVSISEPLINTYSIYPSMFSKGTQVIDSAHITFNPQRFPTSPSQPRPIIISVTGFELGEYHGWFILSGPNGFSVPITISTSPLIPESMMIIIIGALTSIIVIEVSKFANNETNKAISKDANESVVELRTKVRTEASATAQDCRDCASEDRLLRVAAIADFKTKIYEKRYSGIAAKAKQTLFSVIPALFALTLALFALVNNEMVTKVLELNFQNVIALFLLGAGIESVKGLLEKTNINSV
jgi:hypothetical protein